MLRLTRNMDMIVHDNNDSPVKRESFFYGCTVLLSYNNIVLVKYFVIIFNLTIKTLIVIQITFDLISGKTVCHCHKITDGRADAFFLIYANFGVAGLQP